MVNFNLIKNGIGFGLKGFGFFWGVFDRFLCNWLCFGGSCSGSTKTCSLLFLFVAIIFVACGYAIVNLPKRTRKKIDKATETDIKKDE
jgi:hypothetical protein